MQGRSLSTKCLPQNTASNQLRVGGLYIMTQRPRTISKFPYWQAHPIRERLIRPRGQVVKTPPFHGGDTGSTPVGVTRTNYRKGDQKNEKKRTV